MNRDDILTIGDGISLFSKDSSGFVGLMKSSLVYNEPLVFCGQSMDMPADVSNMQGIIFEICICSRYKTSKSYRKTLAQLGAQANDPASKIRLQKIKEAVEVEEMDNIQETKRNVGRKLRYGEAIQLKHVLTGKYLHYDPNSLSITDKSNLKMRLLPYNGKTAQFIVMPKYKVNSEGEYVISKKYLSLESVKLRNHFLHTGKMLPRQEFSLDARELGLGLEKSGFLVIKSGSTVHRTDVLKGLDYIQMYHQDIGGLITAEGDPRGHVSENVHLRLRLMDNRKPKTLLPSTNPNTFWQIEKENIPYDGKVLTWQDQVRFRHASTRKLMCMNDEGILSLSANAADPRTVFKMYPVAQGNDDRVKAQSAARIEHVITGRWLKGLQDVRFVKQSMSSKQIDTMESIVWDHAEFRQIILADDKKYDDAFKLKPIEPKIIKDYLYVCGFTPICADLQYWVDNDRDLPAKEVIKMVQSIHELQEFLVVNSEPNKFRQKLLRSKKIMNMFMEILTHNVDHSHENLRRLLVEIYHNTFHYLTGKSRKNNLYLSKYFDLIHSQITQDNDLGAAAVVTLTQLIKGNQTIVDRVREHHIMDVINYLRANQGLPVNHLYLILLAELCVCDGIAKADNQILITNNWLKKMKDGLYLITRGQFIDRIRNILYISSDNGSSWLPLHVFVDNKQPRYSDDQCKFLSHQLDLYVALCKGRNEYCIKLITKELEFINWEEAFLCLQAEIMPDYMRAKFCETIIGLFVDVGTNYSVVEHSITAFDWDAIGTFQKADQFAIKDLSTIFPVLRDWIFRFLNDNAILVSINIERNKLMANVFQLLAFLVKFGYFDDTYPIVDMIPPILGVIDGRTDEPFQRKFDDHGEPIPLTEMEEILLSQYQEGGRYHVSPECRILVEAKKAGLQVLELIMSMQVTDRIKAFTENFKMCHEKNGNRLDLDEAMDPQFNPYERGSSEMSRQGTLRDDVNKMFEMKKYFDVEQLQNILLDLTLYEYDELLQKAVSVLCRYFFSKGSVFTSVSDGYFITNDDSRELHITLSREIPNLIVYIDSKWDDFVTNKIREILEKIQSYCVVENTDMPHYINQKIIINHNTIEVLLGIFEKYSDVTMEVPNSNEIYRVALITLRALSRKMDIVKNILVGRFDYLINIRRERQEVIKLFTEIYTDRLDLCEQITEREVELIFGLIREEKENLPEIFLWLTGLCVVKNPHRMIKKNMRLVVKLFMENYRIIANTFELSKEERFNILRMEHGSKKKAFYIGIVFLLSTCAELNDDFMESLCQTLLPMDEILEVIESGGLSLLTQRAFIKFLTEVYLDTRLSAMQTGVSDIMHREGFWRLVQQATAHCANIVERLRTLSDEQIYSTMQQIYYATEVDDDLASSLIYFMESLLGMMNSVFEDLITNLSDLAKDRFSLLTELVLQINNTIDILGPLCASQYQIEVISNYLFSGLRIGMLKGGQITKYLQNLGTYVREGRNPEMEWVIAYELQYRAELELNEKFQTFVKNCRSLYEGHNTVDSQLSVKGRPRGLKRLQYCPEGKVESLPLGREFQELCTTFIDQTEWEPERRYRNARVLVKQMKVSSSLVFVRDKDRIAQEKLDVRCMQVLRALIHNQIVALPDDWSDCINDPKIISQLRHIRGIQTTIASYGFQSSVILHCRNPLSETSKQIVACEKAMLFNASVSVQDDLYDFFLSTTTETFFFALKDVCNITVQEMRKRKHSFAAKVEATAKDGERRKSLAQAAEVQGMVAFRDSREEFLENVQKVNRFRELRQSEGKNVIEDGYILLTLEMIAGLCDGQFAKLQNYLRIQSDNPKSFNIVAEICNIVSNLYYNVNNESCELLTQLFDTLNEICTGNQENRTALLDNKIIDYINYIMRTPEFPTCDPEDILALKEVIASVLISMTEENDEAALTLAENVFVLLDIESIFNALEQFHQLSNPKTIPNLDDLVKLRVQEDDVTGCVPRCAAFCSRNCRRFTITSDIKEIKAEIYEVGFKYYQILARYMDVDPNYNATVQSFIKPAHQEAFKAFEKGGMSIEIVKEESLQRVYFRVKSKSIVREEIKERIKWEVDRSSASSKLRDFLVWADSIILDIAYSRRVLSNPIAKFFTKLWYAWIYVPLLLSLAISIMCTVTFKASWVLADGFSAANVKSPIPLIEPKYKHLELPMRIMACVHCGFSACLLISFLISNHPGIRNLVSIYNSVVNFWKTTHIRRLLTFCCAKKNSGQGLDENETGGGAEMLESSGGHAESSNSKAKAPKPTLRDEFDRLPVDNKLEVHLMSGVSLYYILSFILSVVGTILCWFHTYGFYFFTFHLLNIVVGNQILVGVIRAITDSAVTLMWVGSLILVIMFFFTIIGFSFLRVSMDPNAGDFFCGTLGDCFVTLLRQGLIFDMWIDNFTPHRSELQTFEKSLPNSIFSLAMFIVFFIIMLNVIMGIIVDKFAELRNLKWSTELDMRETCFICGRSSYEFETKAKGFSHHVMKEHSQWAYLYFLIYLNDTKLNDFSASALYVYRLLRERRYDFFPMDRAMSLATLNEDDEEGKIEEANGIVNEMLLQCDIKDNERRRYREHLRQQKWHQENIASVRCARPQRKRESNVKEEFPSLNMHIMAARTFSGDIHPPDE